MTHAHPKAQTAVAIYARYSSDNQSQNSIEDQIRLCTDRAHREKWIIHNIYSDYAVSGASLHRPGIQALLADAQAGKVSMVLAEALDRLSRDQEDTAGLFKRLQFLGIPLITLTEGEINELHVGLKGTMNALFLKDLADKTRRGMRGRVEAGKSGGGNAYGYDVIHTSQNGQIIRGDRQINAAQAAVIKRIFTDYANGVSPRAIAHALNAEHIPGPTGRAWGPSTIHGNRKRGTGILNNEMYVGKLIWNRLSYIKDPATGKRVSRLNPEDQWIIQDVPDLRIIDQDLWDHVKTRQGEYQAKDGPNNTKLWSAKRPPYLFSGKVKCGVCGSSVVTWNTNYMGLLCGAEQRHLQQPHHHQTRYTGARDHPSAATPIDGQRPHGGVLPKLWRSPHPATQSPAPGASRTYGGAG